MSNVVNFPGGSPPPDPPAPAPTQPSLQLQALIAAIVNEECAASAKNPDLKRIFLENARLLRFFAEVLYGSKR